MKIAHTTKVPRTPRQRERGAGLVEYALLVALIAVVCVGSLMFMGKKAAQPIAGAGQELEDTGQACTENENGTHSLANYPWRQKPGGCP